MFYQQQMYDNTTPPDEEMLVTFEHIEAHQQLDKDLLALPGEKELFHSMTIALKKKVLEWYHYYLSHPGRDRTERTISQHFYWKGMQKDIEQHCKKCLICQRTKIKYQPWEKLCVDLIGPYNILVKPKGKDMKYQTLWCVTMIDPARSWFKMK